MAEKKGSILSGMFWILFLSLILFWLPLLGQIIAGYVGGKKAGSALNGLIAAILPSIILGVLMFFVFAGFLPSIPIFGAILAGATTIVVMAESIVVIIFAIIGGALA